MRWLFLLLLAANIAYVGWELNRVPAMNPDAVAVMTHTPRIVLLSELQDESPPSAIAQAVESAAPAQPQPAEAQLNAAMADAVVAADEPAVTVSDASPVSHADAQTVQQQAQADAPAGVDRCYTLGPFRELGNLSALTQAIKGHVSDTSFRSKEESEPSMFWVLLESAGSMAKAKALGKELDSKNIGDYFILASGEHKYGISLGIFREKERAYQHEKRVRELGFEPVVEPVIRSHTIYWLDYRMKAGDSIPPQIFKDKLPESVQRMDRPCGP
jgi:hypothetical protein